MSVAQTVARGDLTSRIDVAGRDETAQLLSALKQMNTNLADLIGQVRTSSESIATGSARPEGSPFGGKAGCGQLLNGI